MSIVDSYLDNRRKKKLEQVNQALNKLKEEHPFDPSSLKPSTQQGPRKPTMQTQTAPANKTFSLILGILLLLFVVSTVYYYGKVSSLKEGYEEKEMTIITLQTILANKTALLDEIEQQLDAKIALESNLSGLSTQLQLEKTTLEQDITNLQRDIALKEAQLTTLNEQVGNQSTEIIQWRTCIKKTFLEDPDDCNITSS